MLQARRTALMLIGWKRVRMFSREGTSIQIITDSGPTKFEFESEAEADSAFEEWMKRAKKSERGTVE